MKDGQGHSALNPDLRLTGRGNLGTKDQRGVKPPAVVRS